MGKEGDNSKGSLGSGEVIKGFVRIHAAKTDKKTFFENFSYLVVLQGANYVIPLITIPYLVRVLHPEKFGLITFVLAIIQYFVLFTEYGFNLTATRDIAVNRSSRDKVAEIFSCVMIIKTILTVFGFLLLCLFLIFFNKLKSEYLLYIFAYGIVVGNMMLPVWYFQGMERMKYITILNVLAKGLSAVIVFLVIKEIDDYIYVPVINSLGFILGGFIGLFIAVREIGLRKINPMLYDTKKVLLYFREGSKFFFNLFFTRVFSSSGVLLTGIFFGNVMAGYYGVVEKGINLFKSLFNPFSVAIYPLLAKRGNHSFIFKRYLRTIPFISLIFLVLAALVYVLSDDLVFLVLGGQFKYSAFIVRMLSPVFLISPLYILLGYHIFLPMKKDKEFILTVIIPTIFFLVASTASMVLYKKMELFLIILLVSEGMVLIMRMLYILSFRREFISRNGTSK